MSKTPSRRERLDPLKDTKDTQVIHAGLWLDRYLPNQDKGSGTSEDSEKKAAIKTTHFAQVATIGNRVAESADYAAYFAGWCDSLVQIDAKTNEAKVEGRMVVGLGTEGVLETSVTLHRTYGVPYIPGSALKGIAAAFAHQRLGGDWIKGEKLHNELFGNTELSGCVTFYDALYIPNSGHRGKVLWPDVMAVHHPEYYQGDKPPTDWDSPTVIAFLSATGGYLIALSGDEAWVEAAYTILTNALKHLGVGAKTSSGYGRMTLKSNEYVCRSYEELEREHQFSISEVVSETVSKEFTNMHTPNTTEPSRIRGVVVACDDQQKDYWVIALEDGRTAICSPSITVDVGQAIWVELLGIKRGSDTKEKSRFLQLA